MIFLGYSKLNIFSQFIQMQSHACNWIIQTNRATISWPLTNINRIDKLNCNDRLTYLPILNKLWLELQVEELHKQQQLHYN